MDSPAGHKNVFGLRVCPSVEKVVENTTEKKRNPLFFEYKYYVTLENVPEGGFEICAILDGT